MASGRCQSLFGGRRAAPAAPRQMRWGTPPAQIESIARKRLVFLSDVVGRQRLQDFGARGDAEVITDSGAVEGFICSLRAPAIEEVNCGRECSVCHCGARRRMI